ncbi:hypothetical protein CEXT_9021 [Caerostris extrusa]|uniref:Uncharacterized protein n=1 Tax=Caerostris extrusa TaxID=172846 RepID=A0AAV4PH78_CAEEX|nr:hypothetical protein CEXT_9021 [Caerostris extrusa]
MVIPRKRRPSLIVELVNSHLYQDRPSRLFLFPIFSSLKSIAMMGFYLTGSIAKEKIVVRLEARELWGGAEGGRQELQKTNFHSDITVVVALGMLSDQF